MLNNNYIIVYKVSIKKIKKWFLQCGYKKKKKKKLPIPLLKLCRPYPDTVNTGK